MKINIRSQHKHSIEKFYNENWESWNKVYDGDFDNVSTTFEVPQRKKIIQRIIEDHTNDKQFRMIDIGCGTGVLMIDLLKRNHYTVGIDISHKMVKVAYKKTSKSFPNKCSCLQCDAEYLPFIANSFDGILSIGVLSHQANDFKSLKEISRIIKNGGIIIVTLTNFLKIHTIFDFYYYFIFLSRLIYRISPFSSRGKIGIKEFVRTDTFTVRKYYYNQLSGLFRENRLIINETISCGFGPLTFWKKEIFPSSWSMKLSTFLEKLSAIKLFRFLNFFANSWVIHLQKVE